MPDKTSDEGLKRVAGVTSLAASVVNFTIGAGIYALPAVVGIQMGAAGILGYLVCGLMLAAIMLCFVEVAGKVNCSGGSYAYVEAAFGPFIGFLVNWLFFFGWGVLGSAALMNVLADSLSALYPVFQGRLVRVSLFFILIAFMVMLNVYSAKKSVRFVEYITVVKLIPLVAIILFGFTHIKSANLQWGQIPSLGTMGNTSLVLFFAFAGFETSLCIGGEIKNPQKSVPRGMLIGILVVFIMYLLIHTVTIGVLGTGIINHSEAPLAAVAGKIIGSAGAALLLGAAAVSCFGSVTGDILSSPRSLFAGAKDGILPVYLSKVHPRFATPYWAVITYAALIFLLSVSGGFKQLAILASCSILLIYLAVVLAMVKLRMKSEGLSVKSFRVSGGLVVPAIAIVSIIWLLSHSSKQEILAMASFLLLLTLAYFAVKSIHRKRKIV